MRRCLYVRDLPIGIQQVTERLYPQIGEHTACEVQKTQRRKLFHEVHKNTTITELVVCPAQLSEIMTGRKSSAYIAEAVWAYLVIRNLK